MTCCASGTTASGRKKPDSYGILPADIHPNRKGGREKPNPCKEPVLPLKKGSGKQKEEICIMRKMRFGLRLAAAAAALCLALTGCGSSGAAGNAADGEEQVFNLTLSHGLAEDHAVHIALTAFAEDVKEQSGGTINIEIFPNGVLGSETDNITQIRAGALDMAKVSASTLGNFQNEWNVLSVPYVFNDQEHYYNVMDGDIAQDLYQLTADKGFMGLTWMDSGARSFYTADRAIRTPADLKGLRIRTMDSQMAIDMMDALGGSSTVMGYSEIYTGMQQGVVDGAENNVTALRDHADVTKYYCFDEHTRIPDILLISSETWNAMSDHQRQIMTDCAKKMTEDYKSAWTEFENEVLAAAEEKGVELIRDVDTAAFQEACQSIYTNLETESPEVYAYVERIQAAG